MQTYFVYIIPNVFLFGAIVFAVVTFTRNISAGFIVVVMLMLIQGVSESILNDIDNRFISALLDPFGGQAANYYTRYWTVAEQNELMLPFKGVIIYNRLLWFGIASLFLVWYLNISHLVKMRYHLVLKNKKETQYKKLILEVLQE